MTVFDESAAFFFRLLHGLLFITPSMLNFGFLWATSMEHSRNEASSCQSLSMFQCIGIVSTKERVMAAVANLRPGILCHVRRPGILPRVCPGLPRVCPVSAPCLPRSAPCLPRFALSCWRTTVMVTSGCPHLVDHQLQSIDDLSLIFSWMHLVLFIYIYIHIYIYTSLVLVPLSDSSCCFGTIFPHLAAEQKLISFLQRGGSPRKKTAEQPHTAKKANEIKAETPQTNTRKK